MAHSKARRSSLFSLSARVARREARRAEAQLAQISELLSFGGGGARFRTNDHGDDGCPLCVAARTGQSFALEDHFPGPDGAPPRKMTNEYLVAEALKARMDNPGFSGPIDFIAFGTARPDGTIANCAYSVEPDGAIYWTSPTQRTLITHLDAAN